MAKLDKIARVPIHLINWAMLGLILIATPYVASAKLGGLQIVSTRTSQMLAMGGFGLAIAVNLIGAILIFHKKAKSRKACQQWCVIYTGFLVVVLLVYLQYINFNWLKEWLTQLAGTLGL